MLGMIGSEEYRGLSKEDKLALWALVPSVGGFFSAAVCALLDYLNFFTFHYALKDVVVIALSSLLLLNVALILARIRGKPLLPLVFSGRSTGAISTPFPRTSMAFLYFLLPKRHRENFIGDMQAEFNMAADRMGPFWAKLWFSKEVLSEIGPVLWPRLRRLAGLVTFLEVVRRWIGS